MWLDSKAVNCPQKWGNFIPDARLGYTLAPHLQRLIGDS